MSPADKKWTVYRRGEPIGTFSAREIREELRKGVLQTTDFAAADGSTVQLQIIEIDDIFLVAAENDLTSDSSPRRSRWTSRAEELNMESAPVTQPRPVPLDRRQETAGARVADGGSPKRANRNPMVDAMAKDRASRYSEPSINRIWTWILAIGFIAVVGFVLWARGRN